MTSRKTGLSASFGMIFLILGLSVLVPSIILNLESPQERTLDQDVDARVVITGDLTSRVTEITQQGDVNVSIFNKKNGEFRTTGELARGENTTLVFPGGNVTVGNVNTFNTHTAVIDYTYELYLGWPEGATVIVDHTPIIILLSSVIMIVGMLFTIHGRFI